MNDAEKETIWLAALLHDMGKFFQRVENSERRTHDSYTADFIRALRDYLGPERAQQVETLAAAPHGSPNERAALIVQLADRLSATERKKEQRGRLDFWEAALVSTCSRVKFRAPRGPEQEQYVPLGRLRVKREAIFPQTEATIPNGAYEELWTAFAERCRSLENYQSGDFTTLLFLLREFGWCVPAATPWEHDPERRTIPDVSLYDHSKTTCAIAACLAAFGEVELPTEQLRDLRDGLRGLFPHLDGPDFTERLQTVPAVASSWFRLVRGDVSGIQNFLYRITRAEAEGERRGTAKRLRGRSFYLSLLTEIIAEWMVRTLELPLANLLFCGGGRFDLLVPETAEARLAEMDQQLQEWLLAHCYGELGVQIAAVPVAPQDFYDWAAVSSRADDLLTERKQQKFHALLNRPHFFHDPAPLYEVCHYCHVTPLGKEADATKPCVHCQTQRDIGEHLPKTGFVARIYGEEKVQFPEERFIRFGPPFNVTVALVEDRGRARELLQTNLNREMVLYRLNSTDAWLLPRNDGRVSFGFKFLGNAAPVARRKLDPLKPGKEPVYAGEVLDFDEIASLSSGAKLLGVLKADVDYLGMIFGQGLESPSISRISTFSGTFDLFFGGWLNEICREVSAKCNDQWQKDDDDRAGQVEDLFYVVYSGGDDLMLLGPWDAVVELAQRLYDDFRKYTCGNENVTLSAGLLLVKPHFPIQRFAQLAGEQLEQSKRSSDEKDALTLFAETVRWRDPDAGFDVLFPFAQALAEKVDEAKLPKSFVYFLLRLHEQHFGQEGNQKLMWIPKFRYALARRVSEEVMADDELKLQEHVMRCMKHIRIPVSYVSLKTRKE